MKKLMMVLNTMFVDAFALMFLQSNFSEQVTIGKVIIIITMILAVYDTISLVKPAITALAKHFKQRRAAKVLSRQLLFLI